MKKVIGTFTILTIIFLAAGGFATAFLWIDAVWQTFVCFFPLFAPAFVQSFKNYLTSAYFIVGVIITIFSSAGIWLSIRERKVLYFFASLILDIISVFSIISNLAKCG